MLHNESRGITNKQLLDKKREQNEPNNVLENQHRQGFVIDIIIVQN